MAEKKFSAYKLSRWSRLVRLRDKGSCYLCLRKLNIFKMHAHHIYPKGNPKYYDRAYYLDNGITLCGRCHRIVHSSWANWRKFCFMFKGYMRKKHIKIFNNKRKVK